MKILLAIESGSRGWGFHSPDSDYDVRFVYAHEKEWYLGIEDRDDHMNIEVNEVFDIVGYDVRKALKLFNAGNSTMYEWIQSPIIYRRDEAFVNSLRLLAGDYFLPRKALHHYLGLTRNTYENELQADQVKLKKYFYALRPVLAALWIKQNNSFPPMEFKYLRSLVQDNDIDAAIENLLIIKKDADEKHLITRVAKLNGFIEKCMKECETFAQTIERKQTNTTALNKLFRQTIGL